METAKRKPPIDTYNYFITTNDPTVDLPSDETAEDKLKLIERISELIDYIHSLLMSVTNHNSIQFKESEATAIIYQVVVDILFDMFIIKEESMNLTSYSKELKGILFDKEYKEYYIKKNTKKLEKKKQQGIEISDEMDNFEPEDQLQRSINDTVRYFIKKYCDSDEKTDDWNLRTVGSIDENKKQHTLKWDFCYINGTMITAKQFKRTLNRENGNNSREEVASELLEYSRFIKRLLRKRKSDSPKCVFNKLIRYYSIETYKRIDHFLKIATYICILKKTKIKMKYYFNYALLDSIKELNSISIERICEYIKKDFKELQPTTSFNNIKKVKYYRPALFIEQSVVKKIIRAQRDLLAMFSENMIENFLLDFTYYLSAYEEPSLPQFLNSYLQDKYPDQQRVIETEYISEFLKYVMHSYLTIENENVTTDNLCEWYRYLFTEFAEKLEKAYRNDLLVYQRVRSIVYEMFKETAVFSCEDYEEINDFLLNKYGIVKLHERNKRIWKLITADSKTTNQRDTIISEFMRINEFFIWENTIA